jgi:hypothetical protein
MRARRADERSNKCCTGAAEPKFSWKPMSHGGPVNTAVIRHVRHHQIKLGKEEHDA